METPYLDMIRQHVTNVSWANGKFGEIYCYEREVGTETQRKYRFIEINPTTKQYVYGIVERKLVSPIIAEGIVAYWLSCSKDTSIQNIFETYTKSCLRAYQKSNQNQLDSLNNNFEKRFYWKFQYWEEKKKMLSSRTLFPYVSKSEIKFLKKLMWKYKRFIIKQWFRNNITPTLNRIWKVLKYVLPIIISLLGVWESYLAI